jgi:3-hydroxymyristoyl/3-hydroxydecanoyl-(acyl carrier protein) dehydratase
MLIDDKNKIIELLPQKPPFVMIDKLIDTDKNSTTSGLKITNDNIFVKDNKFYEAGIIENIAQTAAIRMGYECMINKTDVPIGFIGAVKNFNLYELPELNQEIKTTITIESTIFSLTLISGKVMCNNKIIADCEMKIFIQE